MDVALLSTSLNPESKSERLGVYFKELLESKGFNVHYINLKELELPFCDGGASYAHENVKHLNNVLAASQAIFVASPIYGYDVNAVFKNLVELSAKPSWAQKRVGLMVSASSKQSFLAPLGIINTLMIDFRAQVNPRYVFSSAEDFHGAGEISQGVKERLERLLEETL